MYVFTGRKSFLRCTIFFSGLNFIVENYCVQITNMQVNAPGDSPNTDGIHISETQNVLIQDTQIGCGTFL